MAGLKRQSDKQGTVSSDGFIQTWRAGVERKIQQSLLDFFAFLPIKMSQDALIVYCY